MPIELDPEGHWQEIWHQEDKKENPKRHSFDEESYSYNEFIEMCDKCFNNDFTNPWKWIYSAQLDRFFKGERK